MAHYYRRGLSGIQAVADDLSQGVGTKKAEREELAGRLNAAIVTLRSAAYHEERLTREDFAATTAPRGQGGRA